MAAKSHALYILCLAGLAFHFYYVLALVMCHDLFMAHKI